MDCLGDTQDASYQFRGGYGFDNGEIYAVAGTLGTATGNATYVSLGVNNFRLRLGAANVDGTKLVGSAKPEWYPGVDNLDKLYVYYFTRHCEGLEELTHGFTFSNGMAVIDRDLNVASKSFYRFPDTEYVSNSIAVDEKNGIYVASGGSSIASVGVMRKLVWTGTVLSDSENDSAWSSPYDSSGAELPPIIKFGNGTGATPTLMGFGNYADKLVVITDGAKQTKLVAFWRDKIPEGFVQKPGTASRRIAGQIQVTCGFATLPEWIQSEQSVVVSGYGAFVVNNLPQNVDTAIRSANRILAVSLMGPAYPASYGVERFQWDSSTHEWVSAWARSDVSSTSMIPMHSQSGNMAVINGYRPSYGWEVLGLDWSTGKTVHQTIFGNKNSGNGAYAVLQYLDNNDLLFNSFAGPIRIHYGN